MVWRRRDGSCYTETRIAPDMDWRCQPRNRLRDVVDVIVLFSAENNKHTERFRIRTPPRRAPTIRAAHARRALLHLLFAKCMRAARNEHQARVLDLKTRDAGRPICFGKPKTGLL